MGKREKKSVVFVTLDKAGALEDLETVRASPGSAVIFVCANEHPADTFKVEIKDFKRKETMGVLTPIATVGPYTVNLSPGETDIIRIKLHPKTKFGINPFPLPNPPLLPYTTYKFTVEVTNTSAGTAPVPTDPDLDVPPA